MNTSEKRKLIEYINQNKTEKKQEYWDYIAGHYATIRTEVIGVTDLINFINNKIGG